MTISISDQKIRLSTPKMCSRIDRQRVRADEALLHRVERRGADIAVDDADRAEHQGGQAVLRAVGRPARRRPTADGGVLALLMRRDVAPSGIKIPCGFGAAEGVAPCPLDARARRAHSAPVMNPARSLPSTISRGASPLARLCRSAADGRGRDSGRAR